MMRYVYDLVIHTLEPNCWSIGMTYSYIVTQIVVRDGVFERLSLIGPADYIFV